MSYLLSDFDYNLPKELIAQEPVHPRDEARLLVLNKKTGGLVHRHFFDLPEYLQAGDVLVVNDSKVFPARLIGKKELSGGAVEIFLLHKLAPNRWQCLVGGKAKEGTIIIFPKKLSAQIIKNNNDGTWEVEFNQRGAALMKTVGQIGQVPLPPYIKRETQENSDKQEYQTVYADSKHVGSVAAPTAGLHFTKKLLKKIKDLGVIIVPVTLHVGLGTFASVKTEDIRNHKMHEELIEIKPQAFKSLASAKNEGRRIIAVGTTSARTLESFAVEILAAAKKIKTDKNDQLKKVKTKLAVQKSLVKWTSIFMYPGYEFKVVSALVTNFHLPQSTLLMLVSALANRGNVMKAYQTAVKEKYRFFSYGDAMLVV